MTVSVAAIDLGATSGRVVRAEVGLGSLRLDEIARFENRPVRVGDGLHWSVLELYSRAMLGVAAATKRGPLASVAVDSWAEDYGLLRGGRLLGMPYSYRDERTARGAGCANSREGASTFRCLVRSFFAAWQPRKIS